MLLGPLFQTTVYEFSHLLLCDQTRNYYGLALHVQVTQIYEFSHPLHCDQIQNYYGLAEASFLYKNQGVTAVVE